MSGDARFATPRTRVEARADGTVLYRSLTPLPPGPARVTDWLAHWAAVAPDRPFITERAGTGRAVLTYGEAWRDARALAAGLLAAGHGPDQPLALLAPNGITHARVAFAALLAGVPYAPLPPSLAAPGADPARLAHALDTLRPSAVFVADRDRAPGLAGADLLGADRLDGDDALARLRRPSPDPPPMPDQHRAAKILMTSGSTGRPKAVIATQAGMAANARMTLAVWTFLHRAPPVLVDWLPWHHTFGGTHHLHTVLALGGTLHVDEGGAADLDRSLANLRDLRPTLHGAVPSIYAALVEALERDERAARGFLSRLDTFFAAGAALPVETTERLRALTRRIGRDVPLLAGWGATETGPGATMVHAADADPRCIGTPLPDTLVKLAPVAGKTELLVRSPSVTPGYWRDPDRTRAAFDAEGFYRTGDAGRFLDPDRPDRGLAFDGRIAEDFKLATGTWVSAGPLRLALLRVAAPLLRDLVLTGADRDAPSALAWPDPAVAGREGLRRDLRDALRRHNAAQNGSSTRIARLLLLDSPPAVADGEINEKGTVNPRAVLANRPGALAALHAAHPGRDVIVVDAMEDAIP